jgi:hypothetical protein
MDNLHGICMAKILARVAPLIGAVYTSPIFVPVRRASSVAWSNQRSMR